MAVDPIDFSTFSRSKYFWEGTCDIPWLDPATECVLEGPLERIGDNEKSVLRFVYQLPTETRQALEKFIFENYQQDIYGAMAGGDVVTPPVANPPDIWSLLSEPGVAISEDPEPDHYFAVSFECVWDQEHGLSILFNDSGDPIDIGGQGDLF